MRGRPKKDSFDLTKTKFTTCRLSLETVDMLRKLSHVEDVSQANIIERGIWLYAKRYYGVQPPSRLDGMPPHFFLPQLPGYGLPSGVEIPQGLLDLISHDYFEEHILPKLNCEIERLEEMKRRKKAV